MMSRLARLILSLMFVNTVLVVSGCATPPIAPTTNRVTPDALVLMTDFGLKDGAVSAMRGVARGVEPEVVVSDLTHEISPYNIWEGSYRLSQTVPYWPKGTVFVTVVDPGVGSDRKAVALKTRSGHVMIGPDNGLFTLVSEELGVEQVIAIDTEKQRLKGSSESPTFHGRDLFVYVGARLAGHAVSLADLGEPLGRDLLRLSFQRPEFKESIGKNGREGGRFLGSIPVLDPNYGNVWTNLPKKIFVSKGLKSRYHVTVMRRAGSKVSVVFKGVLPLVETFSSVPVGKPLLYFNSLLNLSIALNQGDFARAHHVGSGPNWSIEVSPE